MNRNYKLSHYTHIIDENENTSVLFSASTLALAKVSKVVANQIRDDLQSALSDPELLTNMESAGFIVKSDFDERAAISKKLLASRREKTFCSLTIAPTLGCNFNCSYCFETESIRSKYDKMDEETQNQVISFLKNRFLRAGTKTLSTTWFGGEPLLALDTIQNLSQKLLDLCAKHKIHYEDATIITNGYKLNGRVATILRNARINLAQVTIDGPDYIHDARRFLKGGKGSFKKIVDNLIEASEHIKILIRVNVDRQNKDHLGVFVEQLQERVNKLPNIQVYLAPVVDAAHTKPQHRISIPPKTFSEVDSYFRGIAVKKQIRVPSSMDLVSNACGADHDHSYMIGPKGELYQCWEDFGNHELAVGKISEGQTRNSNYIQQYYDFDPTTHPKCRDCKVMPLCMGGCPKHRLEFGEPQCGIYKFNLEQYLQEKLKTLSPLKAPEPITQQNKRLSKNTIITEYFHSPYPTNYILNFIPKLENKENYIENIATKTSFLNKADFDLLKECKNLLNGEVTNDLYHWAKAIKEDANLKGVPHALKVIEDIQQRILDDKPFEEYLRGNKPYLLKQFLQIPYDHLSKIRINAYYPLNTAESILQLICESVYPQYGKDFIDRIEIAREELIPVKHKVLDFPTIILYIKPLSHKRDNVCEFLKSLMHIFNSFQGYPSNLSYSTKWIDSVTITQGYRLHKKYLQRLNLLDEVYSKSSNHSFLIQDEKLLSAYFTHYSEAK